MKKIIPVLVISFLLIGTSSAQLQNFQQTIFDQEKGLSSKNITCIYQDSKGFMWFGSRSGLFRYDGNNFLSYKNDIHDSTSISSNFIIDIIEDKDGDLWITTSNGLNRFDRKKELFKHYQHPNRLRWLTGMSPYKKGKIWFSTRNGEAWVFDMKTEAFTPVNLGIGEEKDIFAILIDSGGNLWVGVDNEALYVFDPKNNFKLLYQYQSIKKEKNGLSDDYFLTINEDKSGNIWVCTENGLNCITPSKNANKKGTVKQYLHEHGNTNSLSHNYVIAAKEDKNGILWISSANGINAFDKTTGQFTFITPNDNIISTFEILLSYKALCVDNAGSVWYSINGTGLSQLAFNHNKFNFTHQDSLLNHSADFSEISHILKDTSGVLWAGTWFQGLNMGIPKKNGQGYTWQNFSHDPTDPNSISGNRIRQIYKDSRNNLWIAAYEDGLNKYIDLGEGHVKFEHFKEGSIEGESTWYEIICEDINNNLWIGGKKLYLFDRDESKFYPFVANSTDTNSFPTGAISSIAPDDSGNVWLGTWINGLFKVSPPFKRNDASITGKIVSYKSNKDLPDDLGAWQINTILVPRKNSEVILWIGTEGGGLFSLKNVTDKEGINKEYFTNYTREDGLPDIYIQGIEEDNNGDLWIITNAGISHFNPKSDEFANYREGDGLPGNEFGWLAHSKGPDGELYFGSDGILSFYPDSIYRNDFVPPVYITKISLFKKPLKVGDDSPLKSSLLNTGEVIFNHDQNVLTIEFAALNYVNSKENKYKYKLEGIDQEWVDAGTDNKASYLGLSPGKYTFRVMGSNNMGVWNKQGATLKIIIKPPWWKSVPATITYLILFLLAIYFYIKFRENKLIHDKKRLEEKVVERTEELQEVNNKLKEHHEELEQQKEELQQTLDFLKETQSQLVQSEKMASVGQLTAGIAHEINNPVNYINAGIESLKINVKEVGQILDMYEDLTEENFKEKILLIQKARKEIDIGETREEIGSLIKSISNGAERTTEIVKGLRTFSRLDENEIKPADIHEGIDLTLIMLHNKYKHHVAIEKNYGDLPMIECFPGKLNQVFMNILSNAIEAIPEKGTISIKTWADPSTNHVFISIKDDGEGMTESTRSNIFNPFFTTKEVGKGTGLGLSISHGIIEQHKGKVEVKSQPREGTEFIITLPYKQD